MHELQARSLNERVNGKGPTYDDLMTMAKRELEAFLSAVTELFGSEQATVSAQDWLEELVLLEKLSGATSRDWRLISIGASVRLANRVKASSHPMGT
jgi:hypothetical protein